MRCSVIVALLSASLFGQQQVLVRNDLPTALSSVSATWTGQTGRTAIYYWVAARYTAGLTSPALAIATATTGSATLGGSRYVTLTWPALPGAIGYDVLRSSYPAYPAESGSCVCAVAINQSGTGLVDSGAPLQAYSPPPLAVAQSPSLVTLPSPAAAWDFRTPNPVSYSEDLAYELTRPPSDQRWQQTGTTLSVLTTTLPVPLQGVSTASGLSSTGGSSSVFQDVAVLGGTRYWLSWFAMNAGGTDATYRVFDNTASADIIPATSYISQINGSTFTRMSVSFNVPSTSHLLRVYMVSGTNPINLFVTGVQLDELALKTYAGQTRDQLLITDSSGYGNNVTLAGTLPYLNFQGARFNGTNSYAIESTWVPSQFGFSIETIVRRPQANSIVSPIFTLFGTKYPMSLAFASGSFQLQVLSAYSLGAPSYPPAVGAALDANWHHLVLTYSGSALTVYDGGQQIYSAELVGQLVADAGTIVFGATSPVTGFGDAQIAGLWGYGRALSAQEVKARYSSIIPVFAATGGWN